MDFKTFYATAMHRLCDCIAYTYIDEEPHMYSGWLSKPSHCKHLRDGVRFSTQTGDYRRVGNTVVEA